MKNKKDLIAKIAQNLVDVPGALSELAPEQGPLSDPIKGQPIKVRDAAVTAAIDSNVGALAVEQRSTGSGKQAAFWLDDEDRAIFHETGMLLYSQGIKPSHNLVLRAAIRMIPRDHRLVEKVRELIEKDGRKIRHQKR